MSQFRFLVSAFALAALVSCAGLAVDGLKSSRGYTDSDITEINKYIDEYKMWISSGNMQSNQFNSTPREKALDRVRSIYCSCVRKFGAEKCAKSGAKLTGEDRQIWAKGNAAEMAIKTSYVQGNTVDSAECN